MYYIIIIILLLLLSAAPYNNIKEEKINKCIIFKWGTTSP
jgi:hypothetical protein